jgi:hypothetical protein
MKILNTFRRVFSWRFPCAHGTSEKIGGASPVFTAAACVYTASCCQCSWSRNPRLRSSHHWHQPDRPVPSLPKVGCGPSLPGFMGGLLDIVAVHYGVENVPASPWTISGTRCQHICIRQPVSNFVSDVASLSHKPGRTR